jgi:hypothetical protein
MPGHRNGYDALGDIGTTFRGLGWKMPVQFQKIDSQNAKYWN